MMNFFEVSKEIGNRLTSIFLRDGKGKRAVYGGTDKFQSDTALARLSSILRVFPRRQRRPASVPTIRPAGPAWSRR